MRLGVDISNYSGIPTTTQVQCWRDEGIVFVCIGLQNGAIARGQKAVCQGLEREYYLDLPPRDLTIPEAGARVWIDVEPGCFQSKDDIDKEISILGAFDLQPGIYGNATSIVPVLGNSDAYAYLPLWYANYNAANRPPDFDKFIPFNGWTRPTIWQYGNTQGNTQGLCGVSVDLDAMEDAVPEPAPTPQPWPEEIVALRALANAGAVIVGTPGIAQGNALGDLPADEKAALDWIANTANGR